MESNVVKNTAETEKKSYPQRVQETEFVY